MNQLDVYYRALLGYRALTTQNRDCARLDKAIAQADANSDKLVITRSICTVEEDWILEIEKGLVYIEKAIKEERQFIYSNGEVVPIEKVKHVSRESVQHLAKHSDMITRVQEGEDLIPDKLYSVERLNDYAVYENRFLYMLLCYLRDFVTIRYNKILELSNRYDGVLSMHKQIVLSKQTITYSVDLHDVRKDDEYLREHNTAKEIIDRMDLILKTILAFLATPLMECAAKVAMLKPPITKTNVLKMDNNFKGAMALYEFIIAYDKDGYTIEQRTEELSPFQEDLAEETAEACALLAFLTYEYGLGIRPMLKGNYEIEEQARRVSELKRKEEQLEALKRRLARSEIDVEEYILELEKQNKRLQSEAARLEPLRNELSEMKLRESQLILTVQELQAEQERLREELSQIEERHAREIEQIQAECNERIHELLLKHEQEMRELEKQYAERMEELNRSIQNLKSQWREEVSSLQTTLNEARKEHRALSEAYQKLAEEKLLGDARIKALRAERGLMGDADDFTEQESFDQLEKEFAAFTRFYQGQWSGAKKKIRKKFLNYENLKGQNGQNKQP